MSVYLSEEEQVEALKKWWKENGKSVVIGAVLGFGLIFGWQGWQAYQVNLGESASQIFAEMQRAVAADKEDDLRRTAQQLMDEYASSEYATLAVMQLAKLEYTANNKDQAQTHLTWAAQHADDSALKAIARLRLVKLLLDTQQFDAAKNILSQNAPGALEGEFTQLQGDLAYQNGDVDTARSAYQQALEQGVSDTALLRIKLADIAEVN